MTNSEYINLVLYIYEIYTKYIYKIDEVKVGIYINSMIYWNLRQFCQMTNNEYI
jgi:hypothetical protein